MFFYKFKRHFFTKSSRLTFPENKFISFCKVINSIEKENSNLIKQDIYSKYLIENLSHINNTNKKSIFTNIGNIIKLTVPYLLIVENTENNKTQKGELIKNQYNYQFILEKFIKENFSEKFKIDPNNSNPKTLKNIINDNGGIHNIISQNYNIKNLTTNNLFIEDIINHKKQINLSTGVNSSDLKMDLFKEIIDKCTDKIEVYYISRLFTNKMNCGMSVRSIIKCLKFIYLNLEKNKIEKKNFQELIEYLEENIFKYSIGINRPIEEDINKESIKNLESKKISNSHIQLGKFLDLCLCKPGVNLDTIINILNEKKITEILMEIKFDGERSQLHFDGENLKMGSRNFEDQTILYKNLHENLLENIQEFNKNFPEKKIKNFILDGEIICYSNISSNIDEQKIKILDFQELRKKNLNKFNPDTVINPNVNNPIIIKYIFVAFDILFFNNIHVYKMPMEQRKYYLKNIFFRKFNNIIIEDGKKIQYKNVNYLKEELIKYYKYSRSINCEGLIIKFTGENSPYEFGKRKWLKVFK